MASQSDAATDFRQFSAPCTIARAVVTRREEVRRRKSGSGKTRRYTDQDYCVEDWTYYFCLPGDAGSSCSSYASKSKTFETRVYTDTDCQTGTSEPVAGRTFTQGQQVKCWEPVDGYTPGEPYTCGNQPCYMIFDPSEELDEHETNGATAWSKWPVHDPARLLCNSSLLG